MSEETTTSENTQTPQLVKKRTWTPRFMRDFVANQNSEVTADDSPLFFANRLINIYRQLHTMPSNMVTRFAKELLAIPDNIRVLLPSLPGGEEVVDFINYLTPKSSGAGTGAHNNQAATMHEKHENIIDAAIKPTVQPVIPTQDQPATATMDLSAFTDAKPIDQQDNPNSPGHAWKAPESQITDVKNTFTPPSGNS